MVASSSQGPIVAVLGSTGLQGGSVILHLLRSDRPYQLRAITRETSNPAAKHLESQGVHVVRANMNSSADLERAFEGADVVFGVTDFWAHMSFDKEVEDGKRIVDAVNKAEVLTFLWSALEPVKDLSKGTITGVEHFDSKGTITAYAFNSGVNMVVVSPGCYMTNFSSPVFNMIFTKLDDGSIVLALPVPSSTKVALIDAEPDYGAYVREALEAPLSPKKILASSEELTLNEMVKQFNEVTGANAQYRQIPAKDWIALFGEQGAQAGQELYEMLQFFNECGYYGGEDLQPSQEHLAVPVSSWKDFVKQQKWAALI